MIGSMSRWVGSRLVGGFVSKWSLDGWTVVGGSVVGGFNKTRCQRALIFTFNGRTL